RFDPGLREPEVSSGPRSIRHKIVDRLNQTDWASPEAIHRHSVDWPFYFACISLDLLAQQHQTQVQYEHGPIMRSSSARQARGDIRGMRGL
ncbi:hypothetical protein ABK046_44995, partial [Streptomyces caeruleatus]